MNHEPQRFKIGLAERRNRDREDLRFVLRHNSSRSGLTSANPSD